MTSDDDKRRRRAEELEGSPYRGDGGDPPPGSYADRCTTDAVAASVEDAAADMEAEAKAYERELGGADGPAPDDGGQAEERGGKPDQAAKPAPAKTDKPVRMARRALEGGHFIADAAGVLFVWNGRYWRRLGRPEQLALAFDYGGTTSSQRREMVDYWLAAAMRPGHEWGRVEPWEIAFDNGVLDLDSGHVREHVPEDYLERVTPHAYRPDATCPTWLERLEQWFGSVDDDRVAAIQEFFGYVLMSHAKYKKALMIYGPSNTGKSRILEALQKVVGRENKCSLDLDSLDDATKRAMIVGMALNVISELPDGALIKDGAFKTMVSTEEPILVDQKYLPVYTYTPTVKFVIATNTLPAISDRSEATFNRLLIVTMDRVFKEEAGLGAIDFDAELDAEIDGIVAWSVEGARRLYRQQGRFTTPASTVATLSSYRTEQNPLEQFLEERCRRLEALPGARQRSTTTDGILRAFNAWNEGGRKWSKTRLSRTLATMGHKVQPVTIRGRSVRVVVGLELLSSRELPERMDVAGGEAFEVQEPAKGEIEVGEVSEVEAAEVMADSGETRF